MTAQPPPDELQPTLSKSIHREFRAALALAGISARQIAEQLGVTQDHLYMVSTGRRQSGRIRAVLDQFINSVLAEAEEEPAGAAPQQTAE